MSFFWIFFFSCNLKLTVSRKFFNTILAEGVGFEPTVPFGTHAFQACALGHYATLPLSSHFTKYDVKLFFPMAEHVILVDQDDNQIGTAEKLQAHREGKLHRAFSIFIFNKKGQLLLQRRALTKYHSGGLWTNTCCSHPRPSENIDNAVHRRLKEEMGFDCDLKNVFKFTYKAKLDNELTEHEVDHVFIGTCDAHPQINPDEVDSYKWVDLDWLKKDIEKNPDLYTYWMKKVWDKVFSYISS